MIKSFEKILQRIKSPDLNAKVNDFNRSLVDMIDNFKNELSEIDSQVKLDIYINKLSAIASDCDYTLHAYTNSPYEKLDDFSQECCQLENEEYKGSDTAIKQEQYNKKKMYLFVFYLIKMLDEAKEKLIKGMVTNRQKETKKPPILNDKVHKPDNEIMGNEYYKFYFTCLVVEIEAEILLNRVIELKPRWDKIETYQEKLDFFYDHFGFMKQSNYVATDKCGNKIEISIIPTSPEEHRLYNLYRLKHINEYLEHRIPVKGLLLYEFKDIDQLKESFMNRYSDAPDKHLTIKMELDRVNYLLENEKVPVRTKECFTNYLINKKPKLDCYREFSDLLALHIGDTMAKYHIFLKSMCKKDTEDSDITMKLEGIQNHFDDTDISKVYNHFKTKLVEKGYLTDENLVKYLRMAFDEMKLSGEKLFLKPRKVNAIRKIFYDYYQMAKGKHHGDQRKYAALLCDYFEGFDIDNISSNFSK